MNCFVFYSERYRSGRERGFIRGVFKGLRWCIFNLF